MKPYILCNVSMFDLHQHIILVQEDGSQKVIETSTYDLLVPMIVNNCNRYNLNKVHLIGNKKYVSELAPAITSYAVVNYGNNNIEVEIN